MKTSSFNASDILSAKSAKPLAGYPSWSDLEFKSKQGEASRLGGCGLYCATYGGRAIYVGKFLGTDRDPFGGQIQKIRWERHIASFTMRGHKVSVGKRTLAKLREEKNGGPLIEALLKADLEALAHYRGYHASYNRVKFAASQWDALQGDPSSFLRNIEFGYVQFEPNELTGMPPNLIWRTVSNAEELARKQLHLCCNGESAIDVSLTSAPLDMTQALSHLQAHMEQSLRLGGALPTPNNDAPLKTAPKAMPVQTKRVNKAAKQQATLPEHLETDAAWERLEESLPTGWRTEWMDRLRADIPNDALEIHATNTQPHGDVRVRALDLKRARNVLTMAWRPYSGKFFCRTLLSESQVAACPGVEMKPSSKSDPLKTAFLFDATETQEAAYTGLLKLIHQAHQEAKEAQP